MKGATRKLLAVIIMMTVFLTTASMPTDALSTGKTTAKVKASYTYMRKSASQSAKKVKKLKRNASVVIQKEVFTAKRSTSGKYRWYKVKSGSKTGYVRADKIGSLSYTPVKAYTTDGVNVRSGPSTSMSKLGVLSQNTEVQVLYKAYQKGSSTKWYKILQGGKYYYVSSKYISSGQTQAGSSLAAANPSVSASSGVRVGATVTTLPVSGTDASTVAQFGDISFTCTNMVYPVTVYTYVPFSLKGKVTCTGTIENATVGIAGSNGSWVTMSEKAVNSNTFDIAVADNDIKFKTIPAGKYTYKGIFRVNGEEYTAFEYPFEMKQATGGDLITNMAFGIAWPIGTSTSKYAFKDGAPTSAFKTVFDQVYPSHNSWGKGPKTGCCCDVYVGTVIRASGYDPKMPRGETEMWSYFPSSPKWAQVAYTGKESELRSGDVILYKRTDGGQHVLIYVQKNGKGYLAEAAYQKYYGHINTSISKIQKWSNKTKMVVFRPTT